MTISINILWLLPILSSLAAIVWASRQDYSGSYNFTALFTVPAALFVIALSWMIFFGLMWAFS